MSGFLSECSRTGDRGKRAARTVVQLNVIVDVCGRIESARPSAFPEQAHAVKLTFCFYLRLLGEESMKMSM